MSKINAENIGSKYGKLLCISDKKNPLIEM